MLIIPERFVQAREAKGWKQSECARRLCITQQALSDIENGKIENPRNLKHIADELDVSVSWLIGETDDTSPHRYSSLRAIPILSSNEIKDWLRKPTLTKFHRRIYMQLSEKIVSKKLFIISIQGKSMISVDKLEESYFEGHHALIDPEREPKIGDGVLVEIDDEIILRKLNAQGKTLILEPLNPNYPPTPLEKKYKILGVVILTQKPRVEDLEIIPD